MITNMQNIKTVILEKKINFRKEMKKTNHLKKKIVKNKRDLNNLEHFPFFLEIHLF